MKELSGKGSRKTRHDGKHEEALGSLAAERRKEMEDLQQELQDTRAQLKTFKNKSDASAARAQVLNKELKSLKEKLRTVLDKTRNDDKLIEALQLELCKASTHAADARNSSSRGMLHQTQGKAKLLNGDGKRATSRKVELGGGVVVVVAGAAAAVVT